MCVFEELNKEFIFPFEPYECQIKAVTKGVEYDNLLLPLRVGAGKTPLATWLGLYHSLVSGVERLMFVVPAPLVIQWCRWLDRIKFKNGDSLDVLMYRGTPKQRARMYFNHDCIVMSHQIFVKDYTARISPELRSDPNIFVIYDESQDGLRKAGNKIWRFFRNFTVNKRLVLLSGTPVSNPMDTYAVVKLLSPDIYPTKRIFENMHVKSRDFFGNVDAWQNLPYMKKALYLKAVRIPDEELKELPGIIIDKIPYELTSKHRQLYKELVTEEFLMDDSDEIIDATEAMRMFHVLQRFITSPGKLNLKSVQAALFLALWAVYNEDSSKLIVFSNYRDTNQSVLEYFQKKGVEAVGFWGVHTRKQQQDNLDRFCNNENVRVIVANPLSLGVGTDGLQNCCFRECYTELPLTPARFEQACGRVFRDGQEEICVIKCLIAENTIQENLYHALLNKDDLLQKIVMGGMKLRELFS